MLEILYRGFAFLCGQNPDHTWAPGGLPLPCCQRCLGLYVGAGVAAWLHWKLRPRLSSRFLETHGMFLLTMVPCGLHWVPQTPVLRTVSGVLFGFGVATFLWLPLRSWVAVAMPRVRVGVEGERVMLQGRDSAGCGLGPARRTKGVGTALLGYGAGLVATLALTPLLAAKGGAAAAYGLAGLSVFGVAALALLGLADAGLAVSHMGHFGRGVGDLVPGACPPDGRGSGPGECQGRTTDERS